MHRPRPSPATPTTDDLHDPEVVNEMARQFGTREFGAALTSWLGFCLLAFTVSDAVPALNIGLWLLSHVVWESANLVQSWHLKQPNLTLRQRRRLLNGLTVTITLDGMTWGLAPFVMAVPGAPMYDMLYVLFLTCACALSIQAMALHRPAMAGFMVPLVMPMSISHLLSGDPLMRTLGLGGLLILGLSFFYGVISSQLSRQAIVAMLQSQQLAKALQARNADLKRALTTIEDLARRDPLTDCLNRRALLEKMSVEMARQDRQGPALGFLLIDLDHFKRVNDEHGHLVGDQVLRSAAERIRQSLRTPDFAARYGGEEFACVLTVLDEAELMLAAERVRVAIAGQRIVLEDGRAMQLTASIGAALREPGEGMNALARRADQALYAAKATGRNRSVLATTGQDTPQTALVN